MAIEELKDMHTEGHLKDLKEKINELIQEINRIAEIVDTEHPAE